MAGSKRSSEEKDRQSEGLARVIERMKYVVALLLDSSLVKITPITVAYFPFLRLQSLLFAQLPSPGVVVIVVVVIVVVIVVVVVVVCVGVV